MDRVLKDAVATGEAETPEPAEPDAPAEPSTPEAVEPQPDDDGGVWAGWYVIGAVVVLGMGIAVGSFARPIMRRRAE